MGALRRLEQLIQEAVVTVPRALIAETIDLIAVLSGRGSARRAQCEVPRAGPRFFNVGRTGRHHLAAQQRPAPSRHRLGDFY
jgi:hypothetical protein